MDSPAVLAPVPPPADAPTRGTLVAIAAAGPLITGAVCLWSMLLTPWGGVPGIPPLLLALVAAASIASLVAALLIRTDRRVLLLAASLGGSVAVPTIGGLVHGFAGTEFAPAALGLAVAATVCTGYVLQTRTVRVAVLVLLTGVIWLSLLVGVAALLGADNTALYERGGRSWIGVLQLSGIPGHPNGMALLASLALLLQVLYLLRIRGRSAGYVAVVVLLGPVASLAALVWSQSRTGIVCAVGAASILVILRFLPARRWLTAAVLTAAALASLGPPLLATAGFTFHGRWFPWAIAWMELQDDWLIGDGPQIFSQDYWQEWLRNQPAWWQPAHAHNQLLATAVDLGLVGLALLLAAVVVMISVAARVRCADGGWAIAVCAVLFINAGPETVLGVGDTLATYLPVVVAAAVLGSAWRVAGGSDPTEAGRI